MLSYCGLWNRVAALKGGSSRCIRGGGVSRVFQHHPSSVQHARRREKESNIILLSGVAFSWLTYNEISNHVASCKQMLELTDKSEGFHILSSYAMPYHFVAPQFTSKTTVMFLPGVSRAAQNLTAVLDDVLMAVWVLHTVLSRPRAFDLYSRDEGLRTLKITPA